VGYKDIYGEDMRWFELVEGDLLISLERVTDVDGM
jgi:hypothetical protein